MCDERTYQNEVIFMTINIVFENSFVFRIHNLSMIQTKNEMVEEYGFQRAFYTFSIVHTTEIPDWFAFNHFFLSFPQFVNFSTLFEIAVAKKRHAYIDATETVSNGKYIFNVRALCFCVPVVCCSNNMSLYQNTACAHNNNWLIIQRIFV